MSVLRRFASGDVNTPRAIALMFGVVTLVILGLSGLTGQIGKIGLDGDDVIRLVQIKDLLSGQNWFDLTQKRMGPEGGTLMHWSRLIDLPMMLITKCLAPFMGEAAALKVAISVWPVLSALLPVAGLIVAARAFGAKTTLLFVALLGSILLVRHFRFLPGAIDHHNVQLGVVLLAAGLIAGPARRPRDFALAGVALALGIAVGVEVWIFSAALAAFVAMDWALSGAPARKGAVMFGVAFAGGLFAFAAATIAPKDYGVAACDMLSGPVALTGAAAAAGFAALAQFATHLNKFARLAALGALALLAGGLGAWLAPQCLANPLSDLSPLMRDVWLANVQEARPVLRAGDGSLGTLMFRIGTAFAGLGAALWILRTRIDQRAALLFALMIGLTLAFTFYQTRFFVFAQLLALVPLGAAAARAFEARRDGKASPAAYVLLLAAGLPAVWGYAGGAIDQMKPKPPAAQMAASGLYPDHRLIDALKTLPPGRVLASSNFGPIILNETPHAILHANYHRNREGIESALTIFLGPVEGAADRMAKAGITYVALDPDEPEWRLLEKQSPQSLIARLKAGGAVEGLEPVAIARDPEDAQPPAIYRVQMK